MSGTQRGSNGTQFWLIQSMGLDPLQCTTTLSRCNLSFLIMGKNLNGFSFHICFYVLYKMVKNRILSYLLSHPAPSTLHPLYLHAPLHFRDHSK